MFVMEDHQSHGKALKYLEKLMVSLKKKIGNLRPELHEAFFLCNFRRQNICMRCTRPCHTSPFSHNLHGKKLLRVARKCNVSNMVSNNERKRKALAILFLLMESKGKLKQIISKKAWVIRSWISKRNELSSVHCMPSFKFALVSPENKSCSHNPCYT